MSTTPAQKTELLPRFFVEVHEPTILRREVVVLDRAADIHSGRGTTVSLNWERPYPDAPWKFTYWQKETRITTGAGEAQNLGLAIVDAFSRWDATPWEGDSDLYAFTRKPEGAEVMAGDLLFCQGEAKPFRVTKRTPTGLISAERIHPYTEAMQKIRLRPYSYSSGKGAYVEKQGYDEPRYYPYTPAHPAHGPQN